MFRPFVGRDEIRAPLKRPAWEVTLEQEYFDLRSISPALPDLWYYLFMLKKLCVTKSPRVWTVQTTTELSEILKKLLKTLKEGINNTANTNVGTDGQT